MAGNLHEIWGEELQPSGDTIFQHVSVHAEEHYLAPND